MKKYFLIIALIAMVSMIIAPAMAWTTFDVNYIWRNQTYQFIPAEDWSNYPDEWDGVNIAKNAPTSFLMAKVLHNDPPQFLNLGCTNYGSNLTNYYDACSDIHVEGVPMAYVYSTCDTSLITDLKCTEGQYYYLWQNDHVMWQQKINGTYNPTIAPVASFSCTPTSQRPDESVVCTDTSTNTPTDWLWSIDMEGAGIEGWQTHTGQNFTWESHYPGFYSVNLRANNSAGSDWENKTNYVIISANATPNNCDIEPASGYVRTYAQTNDGMTSGGIFNSDIQMNDVEGGAWSNVTNSGGWWCIDTLPLHSLNLYAQATGYTSVSSLGLPANGGRHYLVMWPDYIATPSAGNVTLYVLVYDQQTGAPLYLSSVRVDGNNINTVLKNTGPEGQAMFTVKNDTSVHITASKSGYSTITKVITTSHLGPDTVMISLPRATITGAPTAPPTPSWMTTAPTVGPGPQGTMPAGYTNTQGQIMMDFLARNGLSLVELCFVVTILALLGVKLGK